jgi:hypothetical protein
VPKAKTACELGGRPLTYFLWLEEVLQL